MDKIAILIPCYNECVTIAKVIKDFKATLPQAVIYVYDNNSTDGTADIAKDAGAVVRFEFEQGKGNVIRRMFREIDAECYLMVDGDDTYPAGYAREMCDLVLQKNVDMVIGDRLSTTYTEQNKRPFHNFGNKMVCSLINRMFKSDIKDVLTGYRAMSYTFVKTFPVLSKGFEIETDITIHALDKNMYLSTVKVEYRDRPQGSVSKLNTYVDGLKVVGAILKLCANYKPLFFFSVIALIFLILGLVLFIPIFYEFLNTGLVPKFPSFIASAVFGVMSLQSFFSGVILENIARQDRRAFEFKLTETYNRYKSLVSRDKNGGISSEN